MSQPMQMRSALLALLLSLPLISYGVSAGGNFVWWAGIVLLGVGALVPIYLRLSCGDSCEETENRRQNR